MRKRQLFLIMGLFVAANLQAMDTESGYCEPEINPISRACIFKEDTEASPNLLQNVVAARNHYRNLGQSEQDATFHAINLEMIKVQSRHSRDIAYLEKLWRDIKGKKVNLD